MSKEFVSARLHYIYCVYGDSKNKPVEEVREFFSIDIGDDINIYDIENFEFYLAEDGKEYIKFFDDKSSFAPWNKAFKRDGAEFGHDEICYFGVNYYDTLIPVEEVEDVKDQIEKRRNELCSM